MKLDEAKDIIAKKLKFSNWDSIREHHSVKGMEITMGEVAELYAKSQTLRIMILDFAYWLEVNAKSEMTPYDPDEAVDNYMRYIDKSLGGLNER